MYRCILSLFLFCSLAATAQDNELTFYVKRPTAREQACFHLKYSPGKIIYIGSPNEVVVDYVSKNPKAHFELVCPALRFNLYKGKYYINASQPGTDVIHLLQINGADTAILCSDTFTVKRVTLPVFCLDYVHHRLLKSKCVKNELIQSKGIRFDVPDDYLFRVIIVYEFSVSVAGHTYTSHDSYFTAEMYRAFNDLTAGDQITFKEIRYTFPKPNDGIFSFPGERTILITD